ncbi:MAG: transcription termination/antitermination protein NusA [Fimbriimonadales bacterium]|jgi:N utilization substance protein A|nr:MAG: transcription termination/antitermination protein NusA [Fimbriimonadales bacterium]
MAGKRVGLCPLFSLYHRVSKGVSMMCNEIIEVLKQLEKERSIPFPELMAALEGAIANAYRKHRHLPSSARIRAQWAPEAPNCFRVFVEKEVVGIVTDENTQISVEEARKMDPNLEVGDTVSIEMSLEEMGRVAVQNAFQILTQRLRELEREHAMRDLQAHVGDVITARVERFQGNTVILSYGRVEVILPYRHQIEGEHYAIGDNLKVLILEVQVPQREGGREPRLRDMKVIASRTDKRLVARLLAQESPEVANGEVEIKAIARAPGERTKIAVHSRNPLIDAVGACLGQRGMRIQAISNELAGEHIDVVEWSSDPEKFIRAALSPARVNRVIITDKENKRAVVVVPNNQLRQAVGRGGVNVRLAEELTGWTLEVHSEEEIAKQERSARRGA